MIIDIQHKTAYSYSSPVRLDLQTIRLKPRVDPRQRILHFNVAVSPKPVFVSEGIDEEANAMVWVRVDGEVQSFEVTTSARVETVPQRVDESMLQPDALTLPLDASATERWKLQPYFVPPWVDPSVKQYAEGVAASVGWRTLPFLESLATRIHKDHAYRSRIEGPPWTPDVTLARREGSCRDFTVLFMEACRSLGLATRFVSGYHVRERDNQGRELHAWAEAFLPGAGWTGYDPTIGKVVFERHVPVATSASPSGAAPLTGSFWGNNVMSTLRASVEARILPASPA